jgi:ribosomal protein S18 acetylase RimI-like enzyme
MSELRPESPTQRPDSARPRGTGGDVHGAPEPAPEVDPPTPGEIDQIARHLVSLPVGGGGTATEDEELGATFIRGSGYGPDAYYATAPRWQSDTWRGSLTRVSDHLRDAGAWPSLLLCDALDRPAELAEHLHEEGWTRITAETVMWVGHASIVPHLDPLLRIEALQSKSVAEHEHIEREIFGIAPSEAERRRNAVGAALEAGTARGWIVWLDQEPVAVARMSQGDGVAALQGIGVVEARREQGFGTLITTIATRAAMAVGNRIVWLSVNEEDPAALKIYRRLGFEPLFSWSRWLLTEDPRQPA